MFRAFSKFIFWLIGWKVAGHIPDKDLKKSIYIAIPHTSNWDFPLGLFARSIIQTEVTYIMKSTMFRPPFGWIFRMLNGIPVDRSKSNNFVDAVINLYNERERLHTIIAPEGTRRKVDKLKSGFYFIAVGAKIPLILVCFDYATKEVRFSKPFHLSGDQEKDFEGINDFFKDAVGKHPEQGWGYKTDASA